jgi:hypothetical protein
VFVALATGKLKCVGYVIEIVILTRRNSKPLSEVIDYNS